MLQRDVFSNYLVFYVEQWKCSALLDPKYEVNKIPLNLVQFYQKTRCKLR